MTRSSLAELLEQEEVWQMRTPDGLQEIRIEDMTLRHLLNLEAWLVMRAEFIQRTALDQVAAMAAASIRGEQAAYDVSCGIRDESGQGPIAWLRERPLYAAIGRRIEQLARS